MKSSSIIHLMMIFFSSGILHSQMHSMMITDVGVQTFGDNQEKVRPFIEFGIIKQKSGDIIHARPNIINFKNCIK
ncbi:MAG: hypothetical protein ACK5UE_05720 [Chitinophagales bacterium]|jgi:hypothetical protein|nr:hypothetical protein [Sphingobacteriales bacterium]